jgi:periplasmic mercuric ion binding protein
MKTKINFRILFIVTGIFLAYSFGYSQNKSSATIKIKTSAVCEQCKDRIEQGLAYAKGVKDVNLDVDTKIATVKYVPSKTSPDEIRRAISKLGYDADSIPADKKAYDKLPPCCKKDAKQGEHH